MAFMGMVFVMVALAVLGALLLFALIFFVIGLILRKKHKIAAGILFVLAGLNVLIVGGVILLVVLPSPKTVDTPDGTATLKPSWISKYRECIAANDIEGLNRLFDRHPEMIYYYDANHVMPLDYALYNTNIPMMQCALDHGAVFDDPLRYDHMAYDCGSLCSFFHDLDYPDWEKTETDLHQEGAATDDIIETVRFAIAHGASTVHIPFGNHSDGAIYEDALYWVQLDGIVSPKDKEFLALLRDNTPAAMLTDIDAETE